MSGDMVHLSNTPIHLPVSVLFGAQTGRCRADLGKVTAMKTRVWELAKELQLDTVTLLTVLNDLGEIVRSASSTLEAPTVAKTRRYLARPDVRSRYHVASVGAAGGEDGDAEDDIILAAIRRNLGAAPPTPRRSMAGRHSGQHPRPKPTPVQQRNATWAEYWIESEVAKEWSVAGISDPIQVAAALRAGIKREHLDQRVHELSHRLVRELIRSGEKPGLIFRYLQQQEGNSCHRCAERPEPKQPPRAWPDRETG
jgi:hypothetical protein